MIADPDPFPAGFFDRTDPSDDARYYAAPRLVTHIDDAAIAAVLGWPAGTVRSTASRALAVLRADPVLSRGISHD